MALDFLDPVLVATIERAQLLAQGEEQATARALLLPLWDAALRDNDQPTACVIAHYLAHAQETLLATLDWHRRALAAAADERLQSFYPSLHANVAEAALRAGDLPTARQHAAAAQAAAHLLGADGYGRMIRALIARVAAAAPATPT
jgi:hypothetical protein